MTSSRWVVAIPKAIWFSMGIWVSMTIAYAQTQSAYPNKNIRIVVAFASGGFADSVSRLVGQKLSERLGQPVVIENRAGAGGNIGAKFVVGAAPDGYTLLAHTAASTINNSLYKNIGFNMLTDLIPIANVGSSPGIFAVNASHKAGSLEELIRMTKASGGTAYLFHSRGRNFISFGGRISFQHAVRLTGNAYSFSRGRPSHNLSHFWSGRSTQYFIAPSFPLYQKWNFESAWSFKSEKGGHLAQH
ncbi:MAG: hypothetical protein EBQ69_00335 [Betaproteobacteria bacterium]|nr:hypothetical protein [Betaproteobacteria bacterium]